MTDELPIGWCSTAIEHVTSYVQRGMSPKYVTSSALPVVNQKCVRWTGVDSAHVKFVDPEQWRKWGSERFLRPGDILWNSTGTGTIGRAAIFRGMDGYERVVADSHVTVLRPSTCLPEYLHAWIRSARVQGRIEEMQTGSTNQVELPRSQILATEIPLPPLNEQRRIVAKLEDLLARSRRAKDALDAIPPLLEKLRQSILASAFRGDLTADWRAKHPDVEPAHQLLKRIRMERRKKWEEAELSKMRAKGKVPADDRWKLAFPECEPLSSAELEGLPPIPSSWEWVPLEILCTDIADIDHKMPKAVADGVKFLSAKDLLDDGTLNLTIDVKRISEQDFRHLSRKIMPQRGDIVYSRIGACLGKARLVDTDERFLVSYSCCTIRSIDTKMSPYLAQYLDSEFVLERAMQDTQSVGVPDLGLAKIRRFPVPVSPAEESKALIHRILETMVRVRTVVEQMRRLSPVTKSLETTVMAKAFRGELVEQDPSDEPASVMLERLASERAASESAKPARAPVKREKRAR